MGIYINPGNEGFREIVRTEYIDKTGLIDLVSETIDTKNKLTCISRPRRFGKSFAAKMLCAYYDRTCDSSELFQGLAIEQSPSFREYLNRYNVISLDITGFISDMVEQDQPISQVPQRIVEALLQDCHTLYPELKEEDSLSNALIRLVQITGSKIIFVIDEWDALIREAAGDSDTQKRFLGLLRGWFKNNNFTPYVVAAAYMTGILPIKKDGTQSAISDFREYTMLRPQRFAPFVGFTEDEVRKLCRAHDADYQKMKRWYDGYGFRDVGAVYNPNSVMLAIENNAFDSYWSQSSAAEGLLDYISKDYNGMSKTLAELVGGIDIAVSPIGFANDLTTFRNTDDVLTLLIHLGYLSYEEKSSTVRIPNEEIRREFSSAVREVKHLDTLRRLSESDRLFQDTVLGNEEAVAAQIEKVHAEETAPIHYNRKDSLRSVIKLAYYTYRDHYLQWEELPAGTGYADVVYLPKRGSDYPTLVIELKWNETVEGAIAQIKSRRYPDVLMRFGGEVLLVGISYDKKTKHHTCRIEHAASS